MMQKTFIDGYRACRRFFGRHAALAAALATGIGFAAVSPSAVAAPITINLNVELGRFIDVVGNQAAPFGTFSGNFTITFDPLFNTSATSTGLTINSLSFVPDSALQFQYSANTKRLIIGGEDNGPSQIALSNTDLVLTFLLTDPLLPTLPTCAGNFNCGNQDGNPDVLPSGYTFDSPGHGWLATMGSVSATAAVPEPGALALVGLALAGLAVARRRPAAMTEG